MDTTPDPSPADPASECGETDAGPDPASESVEGRDPASESVEGRDPLRFNNWMKRSATGAVMTGISLGLREALENKKNEPAFMIEAPGQPEDPDNPISLHFDPDSPADSVAVIRRPHRPDPTTPPEPVPPG